MTYSLSLSLSQPLIVSSKFNRIISFFSLTMIQNYILYSNHLETVIKYFVTNLNKHKHSIRARHLVY